MQMESVFPPWTEKADLPALQKTFGSPVWLVDKDQLLDNLHAFRTFTGNPAQVLYPVKANPAPAVLHILGNAGAGADCANAQEVDLALLAGIPYRHIVYNTPFQDMAYCVHLLAEGATVVLDDPAAIRAVAPVADTLPGKVWLRINPMLDASYERSEKNQELMAHGGASSKFGVPEEQVPPLLAETGLTVDGLHLHVGTQMDNLDTFRRALAKLHEWADRLREWGHPVQDLDIGGGLGIAFTPGQAFPQLADWTSCLNDLRKAGYRYYAEPGHALVGNAVGLLVTLLTKKDSRHKTWGIVDAGTDQLAKVTLLHWPHTILDHRNKPLPFQGEDALAGPLCFAGDTLLPNTDLTGQNPGDPLLITNAGAYTFALSNNFNGRTIPAWVLLDGSQAVLHTHAERTFNRLFLQQLRWDPTAENEQPPLAEEQVQALQSSYLSDEIRTDSYTFTSFRRISDRRYRFLAQVRSPVPFVSMPLAIRILGDAAIVATLHAIGKDNKHGPVWGKKLELEYQGTIPSDKPLTADLFLSAITTNRKGKSRLFVGFETEQGDLTGSLVIYL